VARKKKGTASPPTASGERNFVEIAQAYARDAVADKGGKRYGRLLRLAAKRFLADLDRTKKKGCFFRFDPWHANDVCGFIEKLPHVEGKWETNEIVLHPAHVFFLVNLFGFRKISDGTRRFTSALFAVARKNAKALALDTPVPVPGGWTTMGELAVGDWVFGADGRQCRVTATSPVYTDHECFRLEFSNGESVVADAGHLWKTVARVGGHTRGGRTRTELIPEVRTTAKIASSLRSGSRNDLNHSISLPGQLECMPIDLQVGPYTLGAWLGDGDSKCGRITCDRADTEIIDGIRAEGWPVREKYPSRGRASTFAISDGNRAKTARDKSLAACLRGLGVLGSKHIPPQYLRASKEQRIALLQGLMDTDGTISKNGRVLSYTTVREQLAAGVAELLTTLGIKYSWRRCQMRCSGRDVPGIAHQLQFMAFRDETEVFRLRRKLDRMRVRSECTVSPRSRSVQIVDAVRVAPVPVKCITVDSQDSMFLIGRTMLPTHNSTLSAAIMLYCQCCENEEGAQLISAATTFDQSKKVWDPAKRMVEKTADLREAFGLEVFAKSITRLEIGASFKPINAKASTQDGLNPSHVALDEIHAHKTPDLLNVLTSAAGARSNPLWLYTTTEGYTNPGPWSEIRQFAKQLLEGVFGETADHFLAVFFAVDDGDADFDEAAWLKANPLADVNPHLIAAIRKEAVEAKAMPSKLAEFQIKRLNRPASAANGFILLPKWKACSGPVDLDALRNVPCWGGLDLASTRDLTSFRLVWKVGDKVLTWGRRWVPTSAVDQRTERGTVPYAGWVAAGYLEQTDGDVTDYAVIEAAVLEAKERFNLQAVGFDRWNATEVVGRLVSAEVPMIEFIQGPKSYHPAMQELERLYIAGNLAHGDDPVLTWCASNLVARRDVNLNMAPDKKRSAEKIDDMTALLMAVGLSLTAAEEIGDMDGFFAAPVVA